MTRVGDNTPPSSRHAGFALIAVLWLLAALAIIAANLLLVVPTDYTLDVTAVRQAEAAAAAKAGIGIAIAALMEHEAHPPWPLNGTDRRVQFNGFQVDVSIRDEAGKIDLNAAPVDVLKRLFLSLGLDEQQADKVAAAIADWRAAGNFKHLNGAKASDYAAAGYSYGPRNGPFESVDELAQVMGMTPDLLQRAKPALTVFSQRAGVDFATAPQAVIKAFQAIGGLPAAVGVPAPAGPAAANANLAGTTAGLPSLINRAFTIRAVARDGQDVVAARSEAIRFTSETSFWVQAWR